MNADRPESPLISRRKLLGAGCAASALLASPALLRAQTVAGRRWFTPESIGRAGRSAPFMNPAPALGPGYMQQEFFIEGVATAYAFAKDSTLTADGLWRWERRGDLMPYRTRVVVVRPSNPADFNGTALVHWQNVTGGFEVGQSLRGELTRGYAWIGVSAQKIGIDGFARSPHALSLKQWDAIRYDSLNHPGDDFSFDIFSQAGRVLKGGASEAGPAPLGDLKIRRLVATGGSQSAGRLRAYINGLHLQEKIFDAYLPYIDWSNPAPVYEGEARSGGALGMVGILGRPRARIRADLDVPVFVVNSETEAISYFESRQPDTGKFRFWEVAGASHVSVDRFLRGDPNAEARAGLRMGSLQSPNWLAYEPVYAAAVRHLHHWLKDNVAPPVAPLLSIRPGSLPEMVRDVNGNAVGGIRLPELDAPTAEFRGIGIVKPGGLATGYLMGFARDWTSDELKKAYGTPGAWLDQHRRAARAVVEARHVLPEDIQALEERGAAWVRRVWPS